MYRTKEKKYFSTNELLFGQILVFLTWTMFKQFTRGERYRFLIKLDIDKIEEEKLNVSSQIVERRQTIFFEKKDLDFERKLQWYRQNRRFVVIMMINKFTSQYYK